VRQIKGACALFARYVRKGQEPDKKGNCSTARFKVSCLPNTSKFHEAFVKQTHDTRDDTWRSLGNEDKR